MTASVLERGATAATPQYRDLIEQEAARTYSATLVAALQSADMRSARRAALALGRTEDPRAVGPLRNASGSRDVPLRALAVYGYGLLAGTAGSTTDLVDRALADPAGAVRYAAIDAAERQQAAHTPGAERRDAVLRAIVGRDADPVLRARAATALAAWNAPADASALAAAFAGERDAAVRWHEAWTLRRAYARAIPVSVLAAGLRDPDETVRIAFADALARRPGARSQAMLQPLLADPSWRVREQALESVRVLRGQPRTAHLTAVPAAVRTPPPERANTEPALPRTAANEAPRKPTAADAILSPALAPRTSAEMNAPQDGPHPRVRITTTQGTIVVRLFPEWAPLTVANFLNLVDRGWYDGLRWFRVVPDFVAQTGDKQNTGEGDAGYTIPAEENPLEQGAGVISMGLNYTDPPNPGPIRDSAGTQFYLTMSPQLHLDRSFTVFGRIESGFSVLGRLTESDTMTRVERLADR